MWLLERLYVYNRTLCIFRPFSLFFVFNFSKVISISFQPHKRITHCKQSSMEQVPTHSPLLNLKLDALLTLLLFLNGKEALSSVGSSCKLFLDLLVNSNPQQQFLWKNMVQQEFKRSLEYQTHNQLIHKETTSASDSLATSKTSSSSSSNDSSSSSSSPHLNESNASALLCWRRAYKKYTMRTNFNNVRWRKLKNDPHSPTPRQGSAGTSLEHGNLAIFGGWTVRGMGKALQVLHRQEDNSLKWSKEVIPSGRHWDQFRPTYGHTLTALPGTTATGTTCLLLLGGSTQGGYRGVVGCAHRLLVQSNGGNTGADSEWWDANDTVPDCQPRAYHSSTFIQSTTMGIHSSNAARVWVFGGFNDDMGTISELQTLLVPQHNSSTSTNRSGGTGSSSNAAEERMKKRMNMKTASSATHTFQRQLCHHRWPTTTQSNHRYVTKDFQCRRNTGRSGSIRVGFVAAPPLVVFVVAIETNRTVRHRSLASMQPSNHHTTSWKRTYLFDKLFYLIFVPKLP